MRFFILSFLLCAPLAANATVNVYDNPGFGYSFSYPDSWIAQAENGDLPHTYKIIADEGRSSAYCQITTKEDGRFKIYESTAQRDLIQRELGAEFWLNHLSKYNNVAYLQVVERGGLGNAPATRVLVDYTDERGNPYRSWLAATVNKGVLYVAQCASFQQDFAANEKMFHSIIATLKMKQAFHPFKNGFYSDFTDDRPILFPLSEGIGTIEMN